jgi:hypothetical protein
MRSARARWVLSVAAVLAVAVLAVAVAGCGTDEPLPSRTPAPGIGASAAAGAPASGLSEFEARLRDATTREGSLVRAVAAASAGSAADRRLAIRQMRDWAAGERAWLTDHPADPCYDAAASRFEAAIDAISSSADWLEASVEASLAPSDDVSRPSARTESVNALQEAERALTDAAALAKAARSTCS